MMWSSIIIAVCIVRETLNAGEDAVSLDVHLHSVQLLQQLTALCQLLISQ